MKPVCHFLLLLLTLALAACQSTPHTAKTTLPAPLPLAQLQTPAALGQWQLQGSIGQDDKMHVARYQLGADSSQIMDISLYPLPDGWQLFTPAQALERHFGMLSQQLANNARSKYHATRVEVSGTQVQPATKGMAATINSRFISHYSDRLTRITLVCLTLYKGNFVRLTLTTTSDKVEALAASLQAARAELFTHFNQTTAGAADAHA